MRVVCVIGKGKACDPDVARLGFEAGRAAACCGACVVTGGLGGCMDSAAAGAQSARGMAIGLVPGNPYVNPSKHLTVALHTGLPVAFRNALMGTVADLVIMCPGSDGTVQEAAVAHELGTPIIRYGDHGAFATSLVRADHDVRGYENLVALLPDLLTV